MTQMCFPSSVRFDPVTLKHPGALVMTLPLFGQGCTPCHCIEQWTQQLRSVVTSPLRAIVP